MVEIPSEGDEKMKALEVDGLVWREGKVFVSYCPELDVSSCGDTVEAARVNLQVAVRLFLEEAEKMGTLETILQEAGFEKTAQGWQAPRLMAMEVISIPVGGGSAEDHADPFGEIGQAF